MKIFFFSVILCNVFAPINIASAQKVKVLAVVDKAVITNIDLDDFIKIICIMDKSQTCDLDLSKQKSFPILIDMKLKQAHFRTLKLDVITKNKQYKEYLDSILENIKEKIHTINLGLFKEYIATDYTWNVVLHLSQRDIKINNKDIAMYKKNNPKFEKISDEEIKNLIIQENAQITGEKITDVMRKTYFIEILNENP